MFQADRDLDRLVFHIVEFDFLLFDVNDGTIRAEGLHFEILLIFGDIVNVDQLQAFLEVLTRVVTAEMGGLQQNGLQAFRVIQLVLYLKGLPDLISLTSMDSEFLVGRSQLVQLKFSDFSLYVR